MYTRDLLPVELCSVAIASSVTSTSCTVAVDMAPYFPVGRREVTFMVAILPADSTGTAANVTIRECASTSSAASTSTSPSHVLAYDGSTLTFTSTNDTCVSTFARGFVQYRYLSVEYNAAQATTGSHVAISVMALLPRRAA